MKDREPRVSIIIPVYNGSKFVGQAIQSALGQSYKNFEIIVADDGSTDATQEVLKTFGNHIRTLGLPHRGISAARNSAIRQSRGELIALLDSDDLWEPSKLELRVAYLDKHPEYALVYSYSTNFTDKDEGSVALPVKVDFEGFIFKDLFLKNSFANSSIVIRKAVFDALGGYDETLVAMEDYDLNLRLARNYHIGQIPLSLVRRRIHPDSFYSSGYDNKYIYQLPVYTHLLSDPSIERELGVTKQAFMTDFILKFIYKNLYDELLEFIDQKIDDLAAYSPEKAALARAIVARKDTSEDTWRPLIAEFDTWQADVTHKAALYKERRKHNFNVGAGRLEKP